MTESRRVFRRRLLWFAVQWSFIAFVSAYDAWLVVRFADLMPQNELNPMGRWLIELGGGSVEVFLWCKAAGTILVLLLLAELWRNRRPIVVPLINSLSSFQFGLLIFLSVA